MKISHFFARVYQQAYRLLAYLVWWRTPDILEGAGSLSRLPQAILARKVRKLLLVTDRGLVLAGLAAPLIRKLEEAGIGIALYDGTVPNPTVANVEEALALYQSHSCQGILALGGGSSLDCAKGVGARLARPQKTIPQLRGQLKILRKIPPFFAVPTTAGTGSETTLAAVISQPETHEKFAVNDPALIPHLAVLDPEITLGLPPAITAATGMDALTHAVEAYIGRSNTRQTRKDALQAVSLIFTHLPIVYAEPGNMVSREAMLKASFLAGRAFTRAYIGWVHAVAHSLSGRYNTPHGLANAVLLPGVLEFYGPAVYRTLGDLAQAAGSREAGDSDRDAAGKFIARIREMNRMMNIPSYIEALKAEDVPDLAEKAHREAFPLYPVPRILEKTEVLQLYHLILKKAN